MLVLLVLLSCGAYYAMVRQNASLDSIVGQRAVHIRAAADLVAAAHKANSQAYQVLAWTGGSFPRSRIEPLVRDVRLQHAAIERGFASLARLTARGSAERRYVEQARAAWRQYVPAVRDVIEIARIDQSISANAMVKAERAFAVVAQRLSGLARREQELSEQASSEAEDDFSLIATLMPVVIVLSIAASLAISMAVRRALDASIRSLNGTLRTAFSMRELAAAMRRNADSAQEANRVAESASVAALEGGGVVHRLVATLEGVRRTALQMERLGASIDTLLGRAGALAPDAAVRELAGVNQAIVRMDEMSQQGSRMVEEAALAARSLQQQALDLSRAVAAFRLDEATQLTPDSPDNEKALRGTPDGRPGRAGHPYLRLASSRGKQSNL